MTTIAYLRLWKKTSPSRYLSVNRGTYWRIVDGHKGEPSVHLQKHRTKSLFHAPKQRTFEKVESSEIQYSAKGVQANGDKKDENDLDECGESENEFKMRPDQPAHKGVFVDQIYAKNRLSSHIYQFHLRDIRTLENAE